MTDLPDWWDYPVRCPAGHEWRPGRVVVSWAPCSCANAAARQPRGPGHLTVRCRVPGCTATWYRPRHGE